MRVRLLAWSNSVAALGLLAAACGGTPIEDFPAAPAPTFAEAPFLDPGATGGGAAGTTGTSRPGGSTSTTAATSTTVRATTPTTTAREVRPGELAAGDCVTWNQDAPGAVLIPRQVDCAASHLAEVTAAIDLTSAASAAAAYPTADAWEAFVQGACREQAISQLGRHDPAGRFAIQAFHPGPAGWAAGERFVICLVTARDSRVDPISLDAAVPFTGRAATVDQTLLFDPGTCLVVDSEGRLDAVVPCTAPHQLEVSGTVDVTAKATTMPPDRVAWRDLVSEDCRKVTAAYLGRDPQAGTEGVYWSMLTEESWEAGRRRLECVVAQLDGNGAPTTRSGSLRR